MRSTRMASAPGGEPGRTKRMGDVIELPGREDVASGAVIFIICTISRFQARPYGLCGVATPLPRMPLRDACGACGCARGRAPSMLEERAGTSGPPDAREPL